MKRSVPVILVFAAALATGWWTGGGMKPTAAGPAEEAAPPGKPAPPRRSKIPEDVRQGAQVIRDAKDRTERLRQVVILASNLPIEDFERWYRGNHLEFLDGQLEGVFYRILDERWMEADPAGCARYKVASGARSLAPYLGRWLAADEAAALEFVRGLPLKPGDPAVTGLVAAMAGRDPAKALALLDEFSARIGFPRETMGQISLGDREAVVAHVKGWNGERKLEALTSVAAAWLDKDFAWVIGMLEREGVGSKGLNDLVNHEGSGAIGRAILRNAELMPEGWLEEMLKGIGTYSLTYACQVDWLELRQVPKGMSEEVFRSIQERAAAGGWWYGERRAAGLELLQADWLSEDARKRIASGIAQGWQDDPAAGRAWADSLEEPMASAAREGLESAERSAASYSAKDAAKTPAGLVKLLENPECETPYDAGASWDQADLTRAAALAGQMEPATVAALIKRGPSFLRELPFEVAGALAGRWLDQPPVERQSQHERSQNAQVVYSLASRWGAEDPRKAADWVQRLPESEERLWAAKNVAAQWQRHAPGEAKAWAETLPVKERAAVLELLK